MRPILFLSLLLIGSTAFAQNGTKHQVKPKGVYADINLSNDIRVINILLDTNLSHPRSALIDSVEKDANHYTPPVLYALSNILFVQKRYNEGCFWFYVAQLRARYDVNRCADKTANASAYNQSFGPIINEYAFKHKDTLKKIFPKVVDFVRNNEELYDQRWINLSGMGAMITSLGDKSANKELSISRDQWPAIKKKTIDSYDSDFKDVLGVDNDDTTVDRTNMNGYDFRLFKGTPAWDLAKAVQNGDTIKIVNIITRNKALLESREPKFGLTVLSMAVKTLKFESVKTLVLLGADPNSTDTYDGSSPITEAANIDFLGHDTYGSDPRYLKILLEHGGNPNLEGNGADRSTPTPLVVACKIDQLDYVKILINAGANINALDKYGSSPLESACMGAEIYRKPEVVVFLIEKGADYKRHFSTGINGGSYFIIDAMRRWRFDLGSEEYKKKMQLVDFLKQNGMDYRKTKIPWGYEKNHSKEYLEKY